MDNPAIKLGDDGHYLPELWQGSDTVVICEERAYYTLFTL